MTFAELNLNKQLIEGLDAMGFEKPTPIQEQSIPKILSGRDLIACAQTGTGKTAAYLLPLLHKTLEEKVDGITTLIIAPTRELAQQIDQQLEGFAYFIPVCSIAIYGGSDGATFERERRALTEGADIIVATPGRLLSHLTLGYVNLKSLKHLVLDEADRMLDMGFYEDIMKIIRFTNPERQTLFFSATMPPKIRDLAGKILINPDRVDIAISKPPDTILQGAYLVYDHQKNDLLKSLLQGKDIPSIIIFSSTKSIVKQLEKELVKIGFHARSIHSDLEQNEREEVLNLFRNKKLQILVATDIVARGIDIESINLVINYDVPHDAEDYVHRIGRTARASSTGVALTFINEKNQHSFQKIEKLIAKEINKIPLPVGIGEGPAYNPKLRVPVVKGRFNKRKK